MKVALYSGDKKLCVLESKDTPPEGMHRHQAAHEIVEHFRDGMWVWIDKDTRAIRYDSITSMEIMPESSGQEISEVQT